MNDAKVSPASQASLFEPGFEFHSSRGSNRHLFSYLYSAFSKLIMKPVEKKKSAGFGDYEGQAELGFI